MIRKPIQSVLVRFHDEGVFKHQNETHVVFTLLPWFHEFPFFRWLDPQNGETYKIAMKNPTLFDYIENMNLHEKVDFPWFSAHQLLDFLHGGGSLYWENCSEKSP